MTTKAQEVPDYVLRNILAAMEESNRLRALSNEELCREYMGVSGRGEDDELHVNEMMTRLWPDWASNYAVEEMAKQL